MHLVQELATQESRAKMERAEQLRPSRRLLMLRRTRRLQRKAERRVIAAWRRAAELRDTLESADL